jgi:hypothetical protein
MARIARAFCGQKRRSNPPVLQPPVPDPIQTKSLAAGGRSPQATFYWAVDRNPPSLDSQLAGCEMLGALTIS